RLGRDAQGHLRDRDRWRHRPDRPERLSAGVLKIPHTSGHQHGGRRRVTRAFTRTTQMKSTVLAVSAAIFLFARAASDTQSMQICDLTVHEWGTFTSVAGEDGVAIDWDALGCKDDLPGFVNDFGYRGFKWRLRGTVRMETPVMYFYSPREVEASVKVAFPGGLITESYPQAEYEVYQTGGR